ncbi:MAG: hypothetical protein KDB27_13995 [Planctomycetales bacterium]|nr:hypothetical protein [Planctomycetales bacterium]
MKLILGTEANASVAQGTMKRRCHFGHRRFFIVLDIDAAYGLLARRITSVTD